MLNFQKKHDILQSFRVIWVILKIQYLTKKTYSTVGAISVAPLCILSRPFELNNVDLIWLYILVVEIEHYLYTPVPYRNSRIIK